MRGIVAGTSVCVALSVLGPASAPAVDLHKSRLTSIELDQCRRLSRLKDGGSWMCPGIRGYPIYIAEGDQHQMMAFGPAPQARLSATQTLTPVNTIFDGKRRPTVEWRVERLGNGREVPFATIVRYHTTLGSEQGEVLVVTKVNQSVSCRLALIDARANPDAMAMARIWTIAEARKRTCPATPEILGARGKSPL